MNEIVMIEASQLRPHPDNPRKNLGDLSELTDSIKQKGILQNLTVVPDGDTYLIVIGHRRYAAGTAAGVKEYPCRIAEMDHQEQIETMLCENLQRADLTVYEQAQGFQMMIDFGASVSELSKKTGFAPSTIYHRLNIAKLDQKAIQGTQFTINDLIELEKIEDIDRRNHILSHNNSQTLSAAINREYQEQETKKNIARIKEKLETAGLEEREANRWDSDVDPKEIISSYLTMNSDIDEEKIEGLEYYYISEYNQMIVYKLKENNKEEEGEESEEEIRRAKLIDKAGKALKKLDGIINKAITEAEMYASQVAKLDKKLSKEDADRFMVEALFLIALHADDIDYYNSEILNSETYNIKETASRNHGEYLNEMRKALTTKLHQSPIGYIHEMLLCILRGNNRVIEAVNSPIIFLNYEETVFNDYQKAAFQSVIEALKLLGFTPDQEIEGLFAGQHKLLANLDKVKAEWGEV